MSKKIEENTDDYIKNLQGVKYNYIKITENIISKFGIKSNIYLKNSEVIFNIHDTDCKLRLADKTIYYSIGIKTLKRKFSDPLNYEFLLDKIIREIEKNTDTNQTYFQNN